MPGLGKGKCERIDSRQNKGDFVISSHAIVAAIFVEASKQS